MPTTSPRALSTLGRLFRNMPAETVKAIEDVEDMFSPGGDEAITRKEALTGPSEGMSGGNVNPMIERHSDLAPQRGRQAEYDMFSGILDDIRKAMKAQTDAIAAALTPKVAAKAGEPDASYLAVVEKSLKIVAREIFKAETDEDDEDDSMSDKVEKAERHLAKAAKLLAKAEDEDKDDENEDKVEKARADIRKLTKALKPFREAIKAKADAAAVAKAAADAAAAALTAVKATDEKKDEPEEKKEETAKSALETSVAALQDQFGLVTKSVGEVMEMVSGLSRGGKQPNFVAKAVETKNAEPVDFIARAEEAADAGRISATELMKCQNVNTRLTIAKSGNGGVQNDMAAVKADLLNASSGVREVFASLLTA